MIAVSNYISRVIFLRPQQILIISLGKALALRYDGWAELW